MALESDILGSVEELAQILKEEPQALDEALFAQGEALVGLYSDENYTTVRFPDLNAKKCVLLQRAIEDISIGLMVLRSSSLGLTVRKNQVEPYMIAHGQLPNGNVIFSLNWKNVVAFKNYRKGKAIQVEQKEVNAAIYFLTAQISRVLD